MRAERVLHMGWDLLRHRRRLVIHRVGTFELHRLSILTQVHVLSDLCGYVVVAILAVILRVGHCLLLSTLRIRLRQIPSWLRSPTLASRLQRHWWLGSFRGLCHARSAVREQLGYVFHGLHLLRDLIAEKSIVILLSLVV